MYTLPERKPDDELLILDCPNDSLGDDPNSYDVRDLGDSLDDGGGNVNVHGGDNAGNEPLAEPIHFTGESKYQHGKQDKNHGSRQGQVRNWDTRRKRSRQR